MESVELVLCTLAIFLIALTMIALLVLCRMVSGLRTDVSKNTEAFTTQYRRLLNHQLSTKGITRNPWYPPDDPRAVVTEPSIELISPALRTNAVVPSSRNKDEALASLASVGKNIASSTIVEEGEQIEAVDTTPPNEIQNGKGTNTRNSNPIISPND